MDRCQVIGNRITGVGGIGIHVAAQVRSAMIKQNMVQGAGLGGIIVDQKGSAAVLEVENNHVLQTAGEANVEGQELAGIRLLNTAHASLTGNIVSGVGAKAIQSSSRVGIQIVGPSQSIRVSGNDVSEIGPAAEFFREAVGIQYLGPFDRLEVVENRVRRSEAAAQGTPSAWTALDIHGLTVGGSIVGKAVSFFTAKDVVFALDGFAAVKLPLGSGLLTVQGNVLQSAGLSETVRIATPGSCVFSTNQCVQEVAARTPAAVINAGLIIASSNFVQGTTDIALSMVVPAGGAFTVTGNITRGVIRINGTALPAPWLPLNVAS
jgi:hypothetical protein